MKKIKIIIILFVLFSSIYAWYKSFTVFDILNKIQIWTYSSIVTIEKSVIHSEIAFNSMLDKLDTTKETTVDLKNKTEALYLKAKWLLGENENEIKELENQIEKIEEEKEKTKENRNEIIKEKEKLLEDKEMELNNIKNKIYIFPYFMSILVSLWIFYMLTNIVLKINSFLVEIKNFVNE